MCIRCCAERGHVTGISINDLQLTFFFFFFFSLFLFAQSLSRRRSVPLKHHVSSSVRRGEGGVALLEFLSQDRGLGAAATLSACRRVLFGGNVTGFCPGGKGRCSLDHRRLLVLIIHKTL